MELNFEKDAAIDPSALDVEWLRQASLMKRYGDNLADAKRNVGYAKEALETKKADLALKMRLNPDQFSLPSGARGGITEETVKAGVEAHPEVISAKQALIEAEREESAAWAGVNAMEHKKVSLENMVMLLGRQYFAGPRIPRDLSKEWEENQRQSNADSAVSNALKRKPKEA